MCIRAYVNTWKTSGRKVRTAATGGWEQAGRPQPEALKAVVPKAVPENADSPKCLRKLLSFRINLPLNPDFSLIEVITICKNVTWFYWLLSISRLECIFTQEQLTDLLFATVCLSPSTVCRNKYMLIKFLNFSLFSWDIPGPLYVIYKVYVPIKNKIRATRHRSFARQSLRYYASHANNKQNLVHG